MSYIYLLTFSISIIGMEIYGSIINKNNKLLKYIFYIFIIIPVALLAGSRNGVGTDYYNYEYVFQKAVGYFQTGNARIVFLDTEPLYVLIEYISYFLARSNYNFFLLLISIITLFPVVKTIMEDIPNRRKGLSLFIYLFIFYLTSFNVMRQMIAVSFVIYAYKYLIKKEYAKYFFWVIIASLFHNSAIIAILLYFLNMDITLKNKLTYRQLLSLAGVLAVPFGYVFLLTLGSRLPIVGEYFSNYSVVKNESNIYFLILTVLPILPALLFKKYILIEENGLVIYNVLLFTFVIGGLGFINDWAFRLMYYTTSLTVFAYPLIILNLSKVKKNIFIVFIIIYLFVVFYLTFIVFGFNNVIPYESIPIEKLLQRY